MANLSFDTEFYSAANSSWPSKGKHILATCVESTENDKSIIVYQAFNPKIAQWAVEHQTFNGCPDYSVDRMTWIKSNFLWMMYRSGWATKPNQERILAIALKEDGFLQLLRLTKRRSTDNISQSRLDSDKFGADDVRLQWDPDHDPYGEKTERRAIQLGIRGKTLQVYLTEWIDSITDVTDFVQEQYKFVTAGELDLLRVPVQKVYNPPDEALCEHIDLDKI